MRKRIPPIALSLTVVLSTSGCGGYVPLRWPRRDLWASNASPRRPIKLPTNDAVAYPGRVEQEQVAVAVELLDSRRTKEVFGVDFVRNGIQPLMVVIRNDSAHTYLFRKTNVDQRYIPAERAARMASPHPALQAARVIRWLVFLLPGVIFESIIEPATTLDFPGIEEAASRPPSSNRQRIKADFLQEEISDGPIRSNSSRAGVLFVRPLQLGSVIRLPLVDAQTQQSLLFELPTPPPLYLEHHDYPYPSERVWEAVTNTIASIRSWHVVSSDHDSGVIVVKRGFTFLKWTTAMQMTVAIQTRHDRTTQVELRSPLRRTDSAGYGVHSLSIDQFFDRLEVALPRKVLRPPTSTAPAQSVVPQPTPGPR